MEITIIYWLACLVGGYAIGFTISNFVRGDPVIKLSIGGVLVVIWWAILTLLFIWG